MTTNPAVTAMAERVAALERIEAAARDLMTALGNPRMQAPSVALAMHEVECAIYGDEEALPDWLKKAAHHLTGDFDG